MGTKTKAELKEYFEAGDRPTEAQFIDLIDSIFDVPGFEIKITTEYDDGSSTGGLAEAITALGGSDGVVYCPPKNYPIDEDYTIPANAHVVFAKGAYCTVASAKTLTINGTIEAGPCQIFSLAGTGTVAFGNGAAGPVLPNWFGVTATAGIQEAFNSLPT